MASIVHRNDKYSVVYSYTDEVTGNKKQRWECCKTLAEAKRRKTEVEYQQDVGKIVIPQCKTLSELLGEYVSLYGKSVWSLSMFTSNNGLIQHYILPMIGDLKLNEITSRVLEKYYLQLLKTEAVPGICRRKHQTEKVYVGAPTVRKVHNLLRSAFTQALKWDLMERNPATYATVPKFEEKKRDIWDAPTLFRAISLCQDERLKLCLNLAFACSLRMGELLGLTWDCVDLSAESMMAGKASIFINKELQRVSKTSMTALEKKDIVAVFPEDHSQNRTALVLKKPKTLTSTRKVFLPKTVAEMLIVWKQEQDIVRLALGDEYHDYTLVIASSVGTPVEGSRINAAFKKLIDENDLPVVVFHSLRHSSITYKLKLTGGDIKAVQGDSGHAQAKMITDQYSHILDESRVENARLIEEAFYSKQGEDQKPADTLTQAVPHPDAETPVVAATKPETDEALVAQQVISSGVDMALLTKMLTNPEMVNLLKNLSQTLTR